MSFPLPQANPCQEGSLCLCTKQQDDSSRVPKFENHLDSRHGPRGAGRAASNAASIFSFYNTPGQKPRDDCGQRGKGRFPASADLTPKCRYVSFIQPAKRASSPAFPPPCLNRFQAVKATSECAAMLIFPQSAIEATRLHVFANAPLPIHPSSIHPLCVGIPRIRPQLHGWRGHREAIGIQGTRPALGQQMSANRAVSWSSV